MLPSSEQPQFDLIQNEKAKMILRKAFFEVGYFVDTSTQRDALLTKERLKIPIDAAAKFHVGAFGNNPILKSIRDIFARYDVTIISDPNNAKGQRRRSNAYNEVIAVASINTAVTVVEGYTADTFTLSAAGKNKDFVPTGLDALDLYLSLATTKWGRKSEALTGFTAKGTIDFLSVALRVEGFNSEHWLKQTQVSPAEFTNRALDRCKGSHKEARVSAFHMHRYNLGLSKPQQLKMASLSKLTPKKETPVDYEDLA